MLRNLKLSVAALAAIVASTCLTADPIAADTAETRSDYSVTLVGLPVAKLSFVTRLDGRGYSISGSLRSSKLADIFEKTRGTIEARGRIAGDRFQSDHYEVRYTSGKKNRRTEMKFRNGDLQSAVNIPDREKRPANWVPVTAAHRKAVIDPLSSLVLPAGKSVCPRTLPIFDGESRIDLVLEKKGVRPYSTAGFKGDAQVCSVRFVPRAGYRKGNESIDYLSRLKGMEIWFAASPDGRFFAPVFAKVPTKIGQVTVAATRFGR